MLSYAKKPKPGKRTGFPLQLTIPLRTARYSGSKLHPLLKIQRNVWKGLPKIRIPAIVELPTLHVVPN